MSTDLRGWRIALVPDALVNPAPRRRVQLPDVLTTLESCGYGLLQLPAPGAAALLLAVIADQVAEYAHHGYALVAIGLDGRGADGLHWRRFAPLLRHRGVALPPRYLIVPDGPPAAEGRRLAAFLTGFALPLAEQRRWRV